MEITKDALLKMGFTQVSENLFTGEVKGAPFEIVHSFVRKGVYEWWAISFVDGRLVHTTEEIIKFIKDNPDSVYTLIRKRLNRKLSELGSLLFLRILCKVFIQPDRGRYIPGNGYGFGIMDKGRMHHFESDKITCKDFIKQLYKIKYLKCE